MAGRSGAARNRQARTRSIKTKIGLLLVVPLVSLLALWAFAAFSTFGDALLLIQAKSFDEKLVQPTRTLVTELQKERRQAMVYLGGDRAVTGAALAEQRARTDRASAAYRTLSGAKDVQRQMTPPLREQVANLSSRLTELPALRGSVDDGSGGRPATLVGYNSLIDAAFETFGKYGPRDPDIATGAKHVVAVARAHEFLSREDALVAGALAAGRFTTAEHQLFARILGAQRFLYTDTVPLLEARERARYDRLTAGPEFSRFRALEDRIEADVRYDQRPSVDAGSWRTAADAIDEQLTGFESEAVASLTERAEDIAIGVLLRTLLAGGLGLLAVVASVVIAWRISRRLVGDSRRMAKAVAEFTGTHLPLLADTVRDGGRVDTDAALPRLDLRVTEIARIGESFNAAGHAVIDAASREIAARRGVSEVFVSLARRNQALLHRQLSLLDKMERRTEDPAELEDLFRLDHLATRMRRHAEGLVILAGKPAGRGWRKPVPMVDVVRGAAGEVEDYTRVRVLPMPRFALSGTAVADVVHLLAELVENATLFSPPQSPVRISGQAVPNGFVIEIEDRGLGLAPEALAQFNARLTDPPDFDASDIARLGLHVVGRLAKRHGINVSLRSSPYGGTTAIVLVPSTLVVEPAQDGVGTAPTGPQDLPIRGRQALPAGETYAPNGAAPTLTLSAPAREAVAEPQEVPAEPEPVTQPERILAEPAPAVTEPEPEPLGETEVGLPRRRRQANLAPQLLERLEEREEAERAAAAAALEQVDAPAPVTRPEEPAQVDGAAEGAVHREPDAVRDLMSAMQSGWRRGRVEAEEEAGDGALDEQGRVGSDEEDRG